MKITLLIPNASKAILPRTRILYKLLEKDFELEVISVVKKREKTDHFKAEFENFKSITFDLGTIIKDLKKNITGDVIYALKAKPSSFGMAMSLKSNSNNKNLFSGKTANKKDIPVVLDIDAREIYNCFPYSDSLVKNFIFSLLQFNNPNSFAYTSLLEKRIKYADNITVSSSTLQKIYGGTLIYNACDTDLFNSEIYKRDEIRKEMKWTDCKIILLTGEITNNTGLEDLLQAVKSIDRQDIKVVIVGEKTIYLEKMAVKEPLISLYGFQPQQNIAKLLSASDLVVLPQRNIPQGRGKVPVKLFEAMASSKPVIATDVSDFPGILDGCGLISEVGNISSLKSNIEKILEDPNLAKSLGEKARQKCIEKYSQKYMSKKLVEFFKNLDNS